MSFNGEKIILLKPQLYMNLSGVVVKKYGNYCPVIYNSTETKY